MDNNQIPDSQKSSQQTIIPEKSTDNKATANSSKAKNIIPPIIAVAAGLMLVIWQANISEILIYVVAAFLCIYGAYQILTYWKDKEPHRNVPYELFVGVLSITVAIFIATNPTNVLVILRWLFGIFMIVDCIVNLNKAVYAKKTGHEKWWVMLILTFASLLLGLIIMLIITDLKIAIMIFGICLVYIGVADILSEYRVLH
jgi:uncharacterized membrane protein HdeD (DUF308 family)